VLSNIGSAQNISGDRREYKLTSLLSITPKIYKLKEADIDKRQLPQNYMIVRNFSKKTVTLWEFPDEFSKKEIEKMPLAGLPEKAEKTLQAKKTTAAEQILHSGVEQLQKLLEYSGNGSDKEIPKP